MTEDFFTPKLSGARFAEHTLPLEVLPDLKALQDLLIELAKAAFMEQHPDRFRVPRGFDESVQIHLAQVEEGSAALKLVLLFSGLLVPYQSSYEAARVQITQAVEAVNQGHQPTMKPQHLAYFDRLGRSLLEGESLDFPTDRGYAVLNQETRRGLIQASQVAEWSDRVTLRARVPGTNFRTEKYEVQLVDGTALSGNLQPTVLEVLRKAHTAYGTGKDEWLLLECVVLKDRQDRIKSIESIDHVAVLDPLDVSLRLQALSKLEAGWLDGSGNALSQEGLKWLAERFDSSFASDLQLPHLYPTSVGNVLAEWVFGRKDIALEFDLASKAAEYRLLDLDSGETVEEALDVSNDAGWQRVNEILEALKLTQGTAA